MSKSSKKSIHKRKVIDDSDSESEKLEQQEGEIAKGFDRGIDYYDIKDKLIKNYKQLIVDLKELDKDKKTYQTKKRITTHKIIYTLVALIQLKNASRIIEACNAMKIFIKNNNFVDKITVKLAKSECLKTNSKTGKEFVTKARYRKMIFPIKWIDFNLRDEIYPYLKAIKLVQLKQRTYDYLNRYFQTNTHSLRYAAINHFLFDLKKEITLIAKFCGHVDCSQMVRYTQSKNIDGLFDLD